MTLLSGLSPGEKRLFLAGLLLKIALGMTLASSYVTDLFAPFLRYFVESGFQNPYARFVETGLTNAFPYPAAMLYVMALPQIFHHPSDPEITSVFLVLFRLPLLVADLCVFYVLRSWIPQVPPMRVILLYWLSPVLIYINYIHGQLDVIPIALLLGSMHLLFRNLVFWSGVLIGLSLAAKTNVVLIYPFFLVYLAACGFGIRSLAVFVLSSALAFLLINADYLLDPAFFQMVFLNAEQNKAFLSLPLFNDIHLYVVPACWMLLLAFSTQAGLQNRDVFIMFIGFAFCVVLLFVPPMHGWYFWIVPFFAFYFSKNVYSPVHLFVGLQVLYLVYFLVSPRSDYLQVFQPMLAERSPLGVTYTALEEAGINARAVSNLSFTFLQCALLLTCIHVYSAGLRRYRGHKLTATPFLVGIGGDSGVGKSMLSDALAAVFSERNVTILRGDDRHRWDRGHEKWQEFTHLDPRANHLHTEIHTLRKLRAGRRVLRQHYDHATGRFTSEVAVTPRRLIVLEGLHPFFLAEQRKLFDLKIFLAPDLELAVHWKVCRDKSKRNYTTEQVLERIESRRTDAEKYIRTQGEFADIVVSCRPRRPVGALGDPQDRPELEYEITVPNSIHLEPVVDLIGQLSGVEVRHGFPGVGIQSVAIAGEASAGDMARLHAVFDQRLREIGVMRSRWPGGLYGVLLVLIVYCIYESAEHDRYDQP